MAARTVGGSEPAAVGRQSMPPAAGRDGDAGAGAVAAAAEPGVVGALAEGVGQEAAAAQGQGEAVGSAHVGPQNPPASQTTAASNDATAERVSCAKEWPRPPAEKSMNRLVDSRMTQPIATFQGSSFSCSPNCSIFYLPLPHSAVSLFKTCGSSAAILIEQPSPDRHSAAHGTSRGTLNADSASPRRRLIREG